MTKLSAGLGLFAGAAVMLAVSGAFAADVAADTVAPADAPVATATGPARSVAEQIDQYLRSSPAASLPRDAAPGVIPSQDEYERQVHGEVSVAIGTGGYRSAYVRSDFPIGKTGTLSVALSETKGRGGYGGYGYGGYYGGYGGYGYDGPGGYGYGYGGDSRSLSIGLDMTSPDSRSRSGGMMADTRQFGRGCGRPLPERTIDEINQLPLDSSRGRCVDRWSSDPYDR